MLKRYGVAIYRLFFAVLVIAAIVAQFIDGQSRASFQPGNFFSFFTIESNMLAAAIFLIAGIAGLAGKQGSQLAWIRGAATFYMTTTGIIYVLLLSGLNASLQTTIPWVNAVLHYVMPVAVLADWLTRRPGRRITFDRAAIWLAFPLAYVLYSLIRGHVTDWYPYPFLNPVENGYLQVAVTCLIIGPALVAIVWLLSRSTHRMAPTKTDPKRS